MYTKKTERKINITSVLAIVGCFVLQLVGVCYAFDWALDTMKQVPAEMWIKVGTSVGAVVGMIIIAICEVSFLAKRSSKGKREKN